MSRTETVLVFLFYVLASQVLVLAPIVVSVLAPTRSAKTLEAAQRWLERYDRTIVIPV